MIRLINFFLKCNYAIALLICRLAMVFKIERLLKSECYYFMGWERLLQKSNLHEKRLRRAWGPFTNFSTMLVTLSATHMIWLLRWVGTCVQSQNSIWAQWNNWHYLLQPNWAINQTNAMCKSAKLPPAPQSQRSTPSASFRINFSTELFMPSAHAFIREHRLQFVLMHFHEEFSLSCAHREALLATFTQ
jgi:hypothetical protein